MVNFDRESFLLEPISRYAMRQRFSWQDTEVPFYEYRIDFLAFSDHLDFSVAVELKLRNWKRALEQALLYQLCADRVFIALPAPVIHRVDAAQLLQYGVGLISIHNTGRCRRVICSQQSKVILPDYRQTYIDILKKVA